MNTICGWCGKVDQEYIDKCITDDCAMKPVNTKKPVDDSDFQVEQKLGYTNRS